MTNRRNIKSNRRLPLLFLLAALIAIAPASMHPQQQQKKPAKEQKKQEPVKPDLEQIRKESLNPRSKYYFPTLYRKYCLNDTNVMTPEDFRYLYLGYMFQEDYDPYRVSPYSEVTDSLRLKREHSRQEIDTIQHYAILSLGDNPFDLRQMSFLIHVLKERKKDASAKIWEYRLENLLRAIKSTGTGADADNAWYVVYPTHEYDLIQLLGYRATAVDFPEEGIDYLTVEPDIDSHHRNPAKGFFFNVAIPSEQYELKHPDDDEDDDDGYYYEEEEDLIDEEETQ